ncbi:Rap1a/Tai family immunity protein [Rhodobium gokarnense]|uniref:Rap1a immunity protein domain-containing protein n=1 Tax=Rhodobium gokarnense TaxID=364296 RepID=A0ABT3HF53_9HYPH|nr:Rap1a/Tai family immunity protein [Rhodobium gokarnense]MCW2308911.1 hypothetical protein [Rhodobium gokarnense]
MVPIRTLILAAAASTVLAGTALAEDDGKAGLPYSAGGLLAPCMEADNDARWGSYAETECEQYISGFVDALQLAGMTGRGHDICLPELNLPDEIRWAFMRYVNEDYDRRHLPAGAVLLDTLKAKFACSAQEASTGQ